MQRPIALFTDFGMAGPYLGQVKAVLHTKAPGVAVIDLMADAPAFDPRASAYLLAALMPEMPEDVVILGVVDPGVGGERQPMVAEIHGRLVVGPDNGLFEIALRRARQARSWRIVWRPDRLSATFHGRDLFAPVAARLAQGMTPGAAGCDAMDNPRQLDWPDQLGEVIYLDHYGNAMTGLHTEAVPVEAVLQVNGRELRHARTYEEVPAGTPFWYGNSIGLVELAVSRGRADTTLGLTVGAVIGWDG
ncbi:MAG: SAM-dependent chlorinase/fluorinase [Rhodospirillaceae bacterium]|nr:SAM-dependent chlorinase/fluorinase [Rhodospirillales bacterium]